MKIETKYEVGTHIWIVYEHLKEVSVYDTYIEAISYDNEGLTYITRDCSDLEENEIILYEDKETLYNEIVKIVGKINEGVNK